MSKKESPVPVEQKIEIPVTVTVDIYWPEPEGTVGIVYVNGLVAHQLFFHRITTEDQNSGSGCTMWKMEEQYFLSDQGLVEAIKKKAVDNLMAGKLRLQFANRE